MIPFSFRQLSYFVTAAELGSVAAAARRLNVSQPSVSTAIAKLEDVFDVQLFLRHHAQGVSPTAVGERLLVEARSLLAQAEEIAHSAHDLGQTMRGRLDVGGFMTITPLFMPDMLKAFTAAYPEADLQLHEGHQVDLIEGLQSGRFAFALLYDVELDEELELRLLAELPPYALLPAGHPLAAEKAIALRDLASEPMVLLDVPPSAEYFTSLLYRAGLEPDIRIRSPSFETVRGLVGSGFGYSLLVTRPAGDLTYDGRPVVCRPIRDKVPPGRIVLARLPQAKPTRLAETFAAFCDDWFTGYSADETFRTAAPRGAEPRRRGSP